MCLWKVTFPKLPNIDDITIENNFFGLNGIQIIQKFFGVAAISSQMDIRYYNKFNLSFQTNLFILQISKNKRVSILRKCYVCWVLVLFLLQNVSKILRTAFIFI